MNQHLTPERALNDLSAIKQVMDRSTGAAFFTTFLCGMGMVMIAGGVMVLAVAGVHWYLDYARLIRQGSPMPYILLWGICFLAIGVVKSIAFYRIGRKNRISMWVFARKMLNKSFMGIDIPLEILAVVHMVFLWRLGYPQYVVPAIAMFAGVLYIQLGVVFAEAHLRVPGYAFLACGCLGLFFCMEQVLLFTGVVFGVLPIIFGILLRMHKVEPLLAVDEEPADTETNNERNGGDTATA